MDPTTKRVLVVAVIVIIIGVLLYLIVIKPSKKAITTTSKTISPSTDPTGASYVPNASLFPLKLGSQGKEVEQLQEYMQYQYNAQYPKYGIDGKWGPETDANVKQYLNRDNVSLNAYNTWGLNSYLTTVYP